MRMSLFGAVVLIAISAAPVFAQTGPGTTGGTVTTTATRDDDDDFDWGWIGLLGLAGLAPLFMRRDRRGTIDRP
jgi:MYXO-CTERM domain-containing protein